MKENSEICFFVTSDNLASWQLRTRYKTEQIRCVGEIMCEFAKTLLRNYEDFVSRYPYSNKCLQVSTLTAGHGCRPLPSAFHMLCAALTDKHTQEDMRDSRKFEEALDMGLLSLPPNCRQPLDFFLILPVQRLMRYKILLQRIVTLTQDQKAFLDLQVLLLSLFCFIPLHSTILCSQIV